jgi:hypothetical protein
MKPKALWARIKRASRRSENPDVVRLGSVVAFRVGHNWLIALPDTLAVVKR